MVKREPVAKTLMMDGDDAYGSVLRTDSPDPNLLPDLGSLPIPPLDNDFFSGDLALPDDFAADIDGLGGFDFDFDFDFDDISVPPDAENFLLNAEGSGSGPVQAVNDLSFGDARVLNLGSPESDSSNLGDGSPGNSASRGSFVARVSDSDRFSGGRSCDAAGALGSQSPESDCCDREFSGPASSQGSGNCGSGISEAIHSPSQDTSSCDDGSASAPSSPDLMVKSSNFVIDRKVKFEETGKNFVSKRKKENEDGNVESRSSKFRRSIQVDSANHSCGINSMNEEEDKKKARLMRNRESAQLSRQRKKHYVEELEDKVRTMHSTIQDLNSKISYVMAENASLRQQLSGGGMCAPPPPGMYPHPPMAPMVYPWMPCAPYVVKPQGSQVPLVPIPRLKPQQTTSTTKVKKTEGKKSEGKTKKVASVSFLGLLFFIILFGGLVPMVNVKYGHVQETVFVGSDYRSNTTNGHQRGTILTVTGRGPNSTIGVELCDGRSGYGKVLINGIHCGRGHTGRPQLNVKHKEPGSQPGSGRFGRLGNASEPLVASLYVPRNDKLVKIDGNLIIHSVLASEKAMASGGTSQMKNREETGLALALNMPPGYVISDVGRNKERHPHVDRSPAEQRKALASGSMDNFKNNLKSSAADGRLQQWFREGLSGPMLSSGMCKEVFQFDVSPASVPGAIIPASSVANVTANVTTEHGPNTTHSNKGRSRRVLNGVPIPLPGSSTNIIKEHAGRNRGSPQNESFRGNESISSMVVSVLVDPREAGEGDSDARITPKSLSRIFVVVLIDSVRYVTYSCVLPLKGAGPHLVTN